MVGLEYCFYSQSPCEYRFTILLPATILNTQVVNLAYVDFAVLVITNITLADLVLALYPNIRKRAAAPAPTQPMRALP
jgi:hypothetical protein